MIQLMLAVMIQLMKERRLSLTDLAKQEDISVSTVWRWTSAGIRGIHLESFCIGGRRYTTQEAFLRFVEQSTATFNGDHSSKPQTNRQREAAVRRAEDKIKRAQ